MQTQTHHKTASRSRKAAKAKTPTPAEKAAATRKRNARLAHKAEVEAQARAILRDEDFRKTVLEQVNVGRVGFSANSPQDAERMGGIVEQLGRERGIPYRVQVYPESSRLEVWKE